MYSVLNVQATLKSVEEEFEGDVKGIIPTDQPYPFIYDASMGTEISEYEKLPRVGILVSISGHELETDENEPGYYSFQHAGYELSWGRSVMGNEDWKG